MSIFLLIYSLIVDSSWTRLSSISATTLYFYIVAPGDCIVLKGSGEYIVFLEFYRDMPTLKLYMAVISDFTLCESA